MKKYRKPKEGTGVQWSLDDFVKRGQPVWVHFSWSGIKKVYGFIKTLIKGGKHG